jgi:hypothetical protein
MPALLNFRDGSNFQSLLRRLAVALLLGIALATSGCGPKVPDRVPVEGRITFKGGNMPAAGTLNFTCFEPAKGFPAKPGVGEFGVDGKYVAKTGEYPGLMPGTYRITISCWEKIPGENFDGLSYVPKKFTTADQSGLELKIDPADSAKTWNYDFPAR